MAAGFRTFHHVQTDRSSQEECGELPSKYGLSALQADVFALLPKNRGLGANNNNGIRHCSGKYILMIQDDCECFGPPDYLKNTIQVMEANLNVGIINYCGAAHPIDEHRRLSGGSEPCYVTPKPYEDDKKEYFLYTDQPHVVSRAAIEYVGSYAEERDMEKCEEDYNGRWRDQTRFLTAVFPAYYKRTYVHQGAEHSFRTTLFRYKVARFLLPAKPFLIKHANPIFRLGKAVVQRSVHTMEKLHIVR
jgi:glycosyltransferase involved in cell wall biosynthesis